jgi:hypothetical protein
MKEAVHTFEMLVYFTETTRHYNPEGFHLHSLEVFVTIGSTL